MEMSKSELISIASEDKNNETEESETSDDEYFSDFAKLQLLMSEPSVPNNSMKENCPWKELPDLEEDTSKIGNTLWCSCGKCKPLATHTKSICCLYKYEICESYFKGILSFVFIK